MKAAKLIGERLIGYIEDGINWKDHKDIVLDYWINFEAKKQGVNSKILKNVFYVDELQEDHASKYEEWFKQFDFQSEEKTWIKFVDGALNIFYKTQNPTELEENTWFVYLTNADQKAKTVVEEQQFHGNPDINNFWKLSRSGKYEEIAGRDNGYLFTDRLEDLQKKHTKSFKWAILFQANASVELEYLDGQKYRKKCINWASHCENITLAKVSASGKLMLVPTVIMKENRIIPDGKIKVTPMDGRALNSYLTKNYDSLFGNYINEQTAEKNYNSGRNARKNAINTLSDEQVPVNDVIFDIGKFIDDGNVDDDTRLKNKEQREYINKKRTERQRSAKRAQKELEKQKAKDLKRKLDKFKGNLGINFNS